MIKRKCVPIDNYTRFHFWLIEQSHLYGVTEDHDVRRAIEVLVKQLENHISKNVYKKDDNSEYKIVKQFVQIFKQKYLEFTDLEYDIGKIQGKDIKIINSLANKLNKNEVSIEEYIKWLFDDFYPNKNNLSATIPLSISNNIVQEFLYKNLEMLKSRKEKKKLLLEEDALLNKAKLIFRVTKDKSIIEIMENYKDSKLNIKEFAIKINRLYEENKEVLEKSFKNKIGDK